jgi:hypothetical protein
MNLLERLVPDHVLQLVLRGLEVVPSPVEGLLALVVDEVDVHEQFFEVGVLEAVFDRVALLWVEHEHLLQQAVSIWVGLGEDLAHSLLVAFGQLADVLASQVVADERHVVRGGCAQNRDSSLDLVQVVVAGE